MPMGQSGWLSRGPRGPSSALWLFRLGPDSRTLGRKGQVHLLSPLDIPDGDSVCSTSGTSTGGIGYCRLCHSLSKLPGAEHPAPLGFSV